MIIKLLNKFLIFLIPPPPLYQGGDHEFYFLVEEIKMHVFSFLFAPFHFFLKNKKKKTPPCQRGGGGIYVRRKKGGGEVISKETYLTKHSKKDNG